MQSKQPQQFQTKGFRRPILEILEDFSKPIPQRLIKKKPVFTRKNGKLVKSGEVDYIPWTTYIRLLEYYSPGFEWEVKVKHLGNRTVVEGRLTIHASEGSFSRESTGAEDDDVDGYGDPTSNAEASALRRAAAKFHIGLDLWNK